MDSTPPCAGREAARLLEVHTHFGRSVAALKSRLASASRWSAADSLEAARFIAMQRRLAGLASEACASLAGPGAADPAAPAVLALGLHYLGEAVKLEAAADPRQPHDYRAMHNLMRTAISLGCARASVDIDLDGVPVAVRPAALYLRALLLARLAGGPVTWAQVEILDGWVRSWSSRLEAHDTPPDGPTLRADLDSDRGLACGARAGAGPSLYVAEAPLLEACGAVARDLHRGRILGGGVFAPFARLEDHIAALDMVRRELAHEPRELIARAPRRLADRLVAMDIGFHEILRQGATRHGGRRVRLLDESDAGLGVEGSAGDCAGIAIGDLVAIEAHEGAPPSLCRVTRSMACAARMRLGLRSVATAWRAVRAQLLDARGRAETTLLFALGGDGRGRDDAFIVPENAFVRVRRLEVSVDARIFTFAFNEVRVRGRGWVMAGFEVTGVRDATPCREVA